MATISGGRGWTGVVGAIAGSIVETLISGLSLIESLNAWAAARAVSAAASGVDAVPEMRRMPVPPTVDVLTSPGSGRPRICCARERFTRDLAVSA